MVLGLSWLYFGMVTVSLVITLFLYSPMDYRAFADETYDKSLDPSHNPSPLKQIAAMQPVTTLIAVVSILAGIYLPLHYALHWTAGAGVGIDKAVGSFSIVRQGNGCWDWCGFTGCCWREKGGG